MNTVPFLTAEPSPLVRAEFRSIITLFGLNVDAVTLDNAVDLLCNAALQRDGRAHVAVTPNVDHVVRLDTQPDLVQLYRTADYIFADGMPIVWASRLFGKPLPGRVTGADLLSALCGRARAGGWKVAVVGGQPSQESAIIDGFAVHHSGLDVKVIAPSMTFDPTGPEGDAIAERVLACDPDIIFVCVGMPKQERWALHHADKFPGGVMLCAGAAVEFAAGLRRRAPVWMQRTGLEWSWRVMQDPKRLWHRYLIDDRRFFSIFWQNWRTTRRA